MDSTKVDLPAPLGPTTRSSRLTDGDYPTLSAGRLALWCQHHRGAIRPVLDEVAGLVERDRGDAAPGEHLAVVGSCQLLLDGHERSGALNTMHFLKQWIRIKPSEQQVGPRTALAKRCAGSTPPAPPGPDGRAVAWLERLSPAPSAAALSSDRGAAGVTRSAAWAMAFPFVATCYERSSLVT